MLCSHLMTMHIGLLVCIPSLPLVTLNTLQANVDQGEEPFSFENCEIALWGRMLGAIVSHPWCWCRAMGEGHLRNLLVKILYL